MDITTQARHLHVDADTNPHMSTRDIVTGAQNLTQYYTGELPITGSLPSVMMANMAAWPHIQALTVITKHNYVMSASRNQRDWATVAQTAMSKEQIESLLKEQQQCIVTPTSCTTHDVIFSVYDNTSYKCWATQFDPDSALHQGKYEFHRVEVEELIFGNNTWIEVPTIAGLSCGYPNVSAMLIERGASGRYHKTGNAVQGLSTLHNNTELGITVVAEESSLVMSHYLSAMPFYPVLKTGMTFMLDAEGKIAAAGAQEVLQKLQDDTSDSIEPKDVLDPLISESVKILEAEYGTMKAAMLTLKQEPVMFPPHVSFYGAVSSSVFVYVWKAQSSLIKDYSKADGAIAGTATNAPEILYLTVIPFDEYMAWAPIMCFVTTCIGGFVFLMLLLIFWTPVWLVVTDLVDLVTATARARRSFLSKAALTIFVWLFICVMWAHFGERQIREIVTIDMQMRASWSIFVRE